MTAANTVQLFHSSSWNSSVFLVVILNIRHSCGFLICPSSAVLFVNIYVHHWVPWLVLIRCCRGESVSGIQASAGWCCGHRWRSSLGEFWRLFLGFQSVYERLDAPFHAGRHPPGHRICRGRGGGTGTLGGRPCHQTLLIPQLRKKMGWLVESCVKMGRKGNI